MTTIERTRPASCGSLRRALYDGRIFLLDATEASLALVETADAVLREALGPEPRDAQHRLSEEAFFARIGEVRRTLYLEAAHHEAVRRVIASIGEDPARIAFDPARLRVIAHRGDENPRARAVFYPHRDTWYGHPATLVTWWIPLDDLGAHETFVFHPDHFRTPVPNDSEVFDYDAWVRDGFGSKIGWQDRDTGIRARYPSVIGDFEPGRALGFSCERGQILLFSGAHFHRTLPNRTGRTRLSLDFRAVHLDDHAAGLGAPNVDDRSRGSALPDYVHPVPPGAERRR